MLDNGLIEQLRTYLSKVQRQIQIAIAEDDSTASADMRAFLDKVASLSSLITVHSDPNTTIEYRPSFCLRSSDTTIDVRFACIPMGHEFSSFVLALLHVGGHAVKIDTATAEAIAQLKGEYHFTTYVSLTCQNCPETVQTLNTASVLNSRIHHTTVDGGLFPKEVETRGILSVPSTYLNNSLFHQGRLSLEQLVLLLDTGAHERQRQKLENKPVYDILVVGAGPAGAAAAIYAARKGVRTGIVAERFGGQVADTLAIENFISVPSTQGPAMTAALEEHVRKYDVDIMQPFQAHALKQDPDTKLFELSLSNHAVLKSRTVIIATGARWRQLDVPGEDAYRNKGVAYCPHCDGPLFKGKRVAVIGGGNAGVEAAIDLAGIASHVTVLEFADSLRADAVLQQTLRRHTHIDVLCNAQTTMVQGDEDAVRGLRYIDRSTQQEKELAVDGIFVQIGLIPNTKWLSGLVPCTNHGEIVIDARNHTALPGLFAAGDATTVAFKQIIIAMGEGAKASLSAFEYFIRNYAGQNADALSAASS